MKFNITKDQLKGIGTIGLKIGKSVVIEGTKAIVLNGAMLSINTAFSGKSIKSITLDDVLSGKRSKKSIFTNKEEIVDPATGDVYRKVSSFELDSKNGLKNDIVD